MLHNLFCDTLQSAVNTVTHVANNFSVFDGFTDNNVPFETWKIILNFYTIF